MSLQSTVFDVVLEKGPLLPAEIVREVNIRTGQTTDMFFVGAILSEHMSSKQMKMSNAKVGGSKLYYCPGQEPKLIRLYDYLHEKSKKAFDQLKENHVLRESSLDPVIRVAMKDLKDFAVPIEVKLRENEIFWKWFTTPMDEAQDLIKQMMQTEISSLKQERAEKRKDYLEKAQQKKQELLDSDTTHLFDIKNKSSKNNLKSNGDTSKSISATSTYGNNKDSGFILSSGQNLKIPKPKDLIDDKKRSEDIKKEEPKISKSNSSENSDSSSMLKPIARTVSKAKSKSPLKPKQEFISKSSPSSSSKDSDETQSTLLNSEEVIEDSYMLRTISYFQKNNIDVVSSSLLRKNSDCEFEVKINSQFGQLHYYVYSKDKKKISETDLSYAYVRSQNKNLPLCFISPGELTKRAGDILESDLKAANFVNIAN